MGDWASYQLQDFIPFSADVYFRLLARMGETFWPLQLVTLVLGFLALLLAIKGRTRIALALIAPFWAFVGVAFFAQRYSSLNWAGETVCWAWLFQCALLLLLAMTGWKTGAKAGRHKLSIQMFFNLRLQAGLLLGLCGLVGIPLLGVVMGHGWREAEVFGVHPDPTAVVTLGVLLLSVRGAALWAAALVPILWLLVSGLTLKVLGAPWYPALFAIAAVAVTGGFAGYSPRDSR